MSHHRTHSMYGIFQILHGKQETTSEKPLDVEINSICALMNSFLYVIEQILHFVMHKVQTNTVNKWNK